MGHDALEYSRSGLGTAPSLSRTSSPTLLLSLYASLILTSMDRVASARLAGDRRTCELDDGQDGWVQLQGGLQTRSRLYAFLNSKHIDGYTTTTRTLCDAAASPLELSCATSALLPKTLPHSLAPSATRPYWLGSVRRMWNYASFIGFGRDSQGGRGVGEVVGQMFIRIGCRG
ncbi:unnamed protein product [Peniophora sp. CBMAI 1063]|nr:unnamed protein product [Peniophora sp. CBMAI 1063]